VCEKIEVNCLKNRFVTIWFVSLLMTAAAIISEAEWNCCNYLD